MIILTTSTSNQSFAVNAKRDTSNGNANKIDLTDKETNITTTYNIISYVTNERYDTVQVNVSLLEGHIYRIIMYRNTLSDERFRGLVFCTDQIDSSGGFANVEDYRLSDGQYTENTTTNEFTIYE